jgi:hypothetical protein
MLCCYVLYHAQIALITRTQWTRNLPTTVQVIRAYNWLFIIKVFSLSTDSVTQRSAYVCIVRSTSSATVSNFRKTTCPVIPLRSKLSSLLDRALFRRHRLSRITVDQHAHAHLVTLAEWYCYIGYVGESARHRCVAVYMLIDGTIWYKLSPSSTAELPVGSLPP